MDVPAVLGAMFAVRFAGGHYWMTGSPNHRRGARGVVPDLKIHAINNKGRRRRGIASLFVVAAFDGMHSRQIRNSIGATPLIGWRSLYIIAFSTGRVACLFAPHRTANENAPSP